jgi:DNA-binding CsgD family transcriptional regulator
MGDKKKLKTSDKKKLKTMNDISALDAQILFQYFLDPTECDVALKESPKYDVMLSEIAARDFLECLKMYTDALGPDIPYVPLSDDQRQEIANIPDEEMRERLSEAEYQVMRGLMDGKTLKEIASERKTSRKTTEYQKNSALMKITAAGYKVTTVPKKLTPWNE